MKGRMEIAVSTLLRTGVLLSVATIAAGLVMAFVGHTESLSSPAALGALTAPGAHSPNSVREVTAGVRLGNGHAVIAAGLLLLIATPVARVALSIVSFAIERDSLYVTITAAVFVILMISFAVGAAGG